jgi:hypothetical protein
MGASPELSGWVREWRLRNSHLAQSPDASTVAEVHAHVRIIVGMMAEMMPSISKGIGGTEEELRHLEDRRRELSRIVEELGDKGEKFGRELATAKKELRADRAAVKKQLDSMRGWIGSVARKAGAAQETLDQVLRQFRALTSPDMRVDIDAWAATQAQLGQRVAAGRTAERRLATMDGEGLSAPIADYHRLDREHGACQSQAVDSATGLASLSLDATTGKWRARIRAWRESRDDTVRLATRRRAAESRKDVAEGEIEKFAEEKSRLATEVAEGRGAETELRRRIRAFLDEMFATDRIPPRWFDVAMGSAVPPVRTAQWLLTAVEVVLYRIVYEVVDSAAPLGEPPADDGRRAEHDRLLARCAEFRP